MSSAVPPESTTTGSASGAAPESVRTIHRGTRQLSGAFLTGLILILPLRAALDTSSYGALYGWIAAGAVVVVLFGLLLRLAGVPMGLGVALLATGAFAVIAMITLAVVALIGDPGTNVSVALLAGIPAAAVAAPAAVVAARLARDDTGALALGAVACFVGLSLAGGIGPAVGDQVEEARQEAEKVRELEDSGLTAYLPAIDGTRAEFSSTRLVRPEGGAGVLVGYSLRYEPESAAAVDYESASISVEIGFADDPGCEPITDYLVCRESDGYVVTEREGVASEVSADRGGMRLRAVIREGTGELPDIDDIGRALVDADQREWEEVLDAST